LSGGLVGRLVGWLAGWLGGWISYTNEDSHALRSYTVYT
jgi:hypothetical protein